jgi:hypothetical protein
MAGYRDLIFYQKAQEVVKMVNEMISSTIRTLRNKPGKRNLREFTPPYTPSPYPLEECET